MAVVCRICKEVLFNVRLMSCACELQQREWWNWVTVVDMASVGCNIY